MLVDISLHIYNVNVTQTLEERGFYIDKVVISLQQDQCNAIPSNKGQGEFLAHPGEHVFLFNPKTQKLANWLEETWKGLGGSGLEIREMGWDMIIS